MVVIVAVIIIIIVRIVGRILAIIVEITNTRLMLEFLKTIPTISGWCAYS